MLVSRSVITYLQEVNLWRRFIFPVSVASVAITIAVVGAILVGVQRGQAMSLNRADDEAIADVAKTLKKLNRRLDKLGSFWFEKLVVGALILLGGWIWTQERRMSRLEDTYRLERAAAIGAAINELRTELTR